MNDIGGALTMARVRAAMERVREQPLNGKIYVNDGMYQVRRTWRERWCTKPWRPWRRHRSEPILPDGEVIRLPDGAMIMNRKTKDELVKALEE